MRFVDQRRERPLVAEVSKRLCLCRENTVNTHQRIRTDTRNGDQEEGFEPVHWYGDVVCRNPRHADDVSSVAVLSSDTHFRVWKLLRDRGRERPCSLEDEGRAPRMCNSNHDATSRVVVEPPLSCHTVPDFRQHPGPRSAPLTPAHDRHGVTQAVLLSAPAPHVIKTGAKKRFQARAPSAA